MKLLRCHIEDYGTLSNCDFDFSEGINDLCEHNGYGKSTLASFIKAMFYGLDAFTARTTDFVDRMHFYPFSGGKFGGSLTFYMGGHTYRIERFFGKKSAKEDTCAVYRDDVPTDELTQDHKEVGHTVFGVDRASFERTLFIDTEAIDMKATNGISAKLGRVVDATDEAATFEEAIKRLKDAKKELKADRGNNGEISRIKTEIDRLKSEISNMTAISDALGAKYEELRRLQETLRALRARREQCAGAAALQAAWDAHDTIAKQLEEKAAMAESIRAAYPQGLPSAEELTGLAAAVKARESAASRVSLTGLTEEDTAHLAALTARFPAGVPTEETLKTIDRLAEQYSRLTEGTDVPPVKSERLIAQEQRFSDGLPTDEIIAEQDAALQRLSDINTLLTATLTPNAAQPVKRKTPYLIAALLALCVAVGGGFTLFISAVAGGVLLGVGAAGALLGFTLYATSARTTSPASAGDEEYRLRAEATQIREQMRRLLASYRYTAAMGAEVDYAHLKRDIEEYCSERAKYEAACAAYERDRTLAEEIAAELQTCLAGYVKDHDYRDGAHRLRSDAAEFCRLTEKAEKQAAARTESEQALAAAEEKISTLLTPYGITPDADPTETLRVLSERHRELSRLTQECTQLSEKMAAYRTEKGLDTRPAEEEAREDIESLNALIGDAEHSLSLLMAEIDDDEYHIESLGDTENALLAAEEKMAAAKTRAKLLEAAIDILNRSEEALRERYVAPVKTVFLRYADAIERTIGDRVHMTPSFGITFERGGEIREDRHLSAGERSMCGLCFRLALIDNMYQGEKPFIVLDDPFIHLDEVHLESTLALLRELAGDRQILYFTCHESRRAVK